MFGFNFERKKDSEKLPPKVPMEKGRGKNASNPLDFTREHQEEEKFMKRNEPLKNFVPPEEVSSGEDWKTIGERLDVPEEKEEEEELDETPLIHSAMSEEEMYKVVDKYIGRPLGGSEEEQASIDKYFNKKQKKPEITSEIPGLEPEIKTKFDKTGKREERKVLRGISPVKRIPDSDRKIGPRMRSKPSDRENIKTMSDSKKQRMARSEIKEFLDSPEGKK